MALTKYRQRRADQLREPILELREQGKTFPEICAELHTTIRTVRHVLYAPEAERERVRRARERALSLAPKAIGAIERELEKGNGAAGLRLLEDLGIVGREAIHVQVNAQNAQVNFNHEEIEAAHAIAARMQESHRLAAEYDPPEPSEIVSDPIT